jgi:hypothetical protein
MPSHAVGLCRCAPCLPTSPATGGFCRGLVPDFISEDHLSTLEGWLKYQAIDPATVTPEELENWRSIFEEVRESAAAVPKVGRMKLRPLVTHEHRYAVAVREGSDLWLTLWIRRSPKPEFFVCIPRGDRAWDHAASEELRPEVWFAKAPAVNGRVSRDGTSRCIHGPWPEERRGALRSDGLFGSDGSCTWRVGAARRQRRRRSCGARLPTVGLTN